MILPYLAALTFTTLRKLWIGGPPSHLKPPRHHLFLWLNGLDPDLGHCQFVEFLGNSLGILSTKSSFSKGGKIHFRIQLKAFKSLCSTTVFAQLQLEVSNLPCGAGAQKGVAKSTCHLRCSASRPQRSRQIPRIWPMGFLRCSEQGNPWVSGRFLQHCKLERLQKADVTAERR